MQKESIEKTAGLDGTDEELIDVLIAQMQKESIEKTAGLDGTDEELIDVLIAISVVAKRLARKLQNEQKGESQHEQNE